MHLIMCFSLFFLFLEFDKILDKAGDVENETCEVQRDGVVTYIGMLERYNAYILTKNRVIV